MGEVSDFRKDLSHKDWSHIVARIFLWILIIGSILLFLFASFGFARVLIDGHDFSDLVSVQASNVVSPFWLNVSDQRFNDTALILLVNSTLHSEIVSLNLSDDDSAYALVTQLANYLPISDQRFNDTGYINGQLANYLLIGDQRFNDSGAIAFLNSTSLHTFGDQTLFGSLIIEGNLDVIGLYVNLTVVNEIVNGSILPDLSGLFDLGSPSQVWNNVYANNLYNKSEVDSMFANLSDDDSMFALISDTYNKSEVDLLIANVSFNDTLSDSIYALNSSLNDEINGRIGNDSILSSFISSINTSGNIESLGFYNSSYVDFLFGNLSDDDSLYALNSSLANYYLASNPNAFVNQSLTDSLYYNKSYIDVISSHQLNRYAGFKVLPSIVDNGDGSLNFSSSVVDLYNNSDFIGLPSSYNILGGHTGVAGVNSIPDGVISYLVAMYNAGSPIVQVITNGDLIHQSDVVPLITISRSGNELYLLNWGTMGNGMPEKLSDRLVRSEPFTVETGLDLSEGGNNTLRTSAGIVWFGVTRLSLNVTDTALSGVDVYYHNSSGGYVKVDVLNGSYYNDVWDNGTGLINLSNGTYANVWVYRNVMTAPEIDVIVGHAQYDSLSEALLGQPPTTLPFSIVSNYILVGRITFLSGASSGIVGSIHALTFGDAIVSNHNDLANIQGGSAGQFYHLSAVQYQNTVDISGMITANPVYGVLSVNGVADITSSETFTVNTLPYNKTGTLSFLSYNSTLDISFVGVSGGDTSAIFQSYEIFDGSGSEWYEALDPLNSTVLILLGNASNINGSSWGYQQSPYLDVNADDGADEKGIAFSTNGLWKWALYVPANQNDSQICIQSSINPLDNQFCINADGSVNIEGNVSAYNLYTKVQVDSLIANVSFNDTLSDSIYALNSSLNDEISARIGNDSILENKKLNVSDQRYNDTALILLVNTSSNIQSLGFLNSSQDYANDSASFYSINNPNGFLNGSGVVISVGNWSLDKVNYLNATADFQNDSLSFYSINNPNGFQNASQVNASITSALATTFFLPNASVTITGTNTAGNNVGNLSFQDSQYYNTSYSGGIDIRANFTNVSKFNDVRLYLLYSTNNAGRRLSLSIWDCLTNSWQFGYGDISPQTQYTLFDIPVNDYLEHLCNGTIQTRLTTTNGGAGADSVSIDQWNLIQGIVVSSNTVDTFVTSFSTLNSGSNNQTLNLTQNSGVSLLASIDLSAYANASADYLNDSSSWYSINNPSGFQNASQVNASINSALSNTVAQVLVVGTGYKSIKSSDVKGAGQIVLVNGSGVVTGINTSFLSGGIDGLSNYFAFYVNNTRYFVFPINSNTSANLTATLFGNQTNWTGGNLTTDLILVVNTANNTFSWATGYDTKSTGQYSQASGYQSQALSDYAVAMGYQNIANGSNAVAFGSQTVASNIDATAFGLFTTASGNTAMVWGQNNIASGTYSTAFGFNTVASSQSSTALGESTNANGKNCVAMGFSTNCTAYADVVIGRWNTGGGTFNSWVSTDKVFEIGIGTNASNRSNAFTVYKNGSIDAPALDSKYVQNSLLWTNYSTGGTTTNNTVFTQLTGLNDVLNNASSYIINCHLLQSAVASTTGVVLQVNTTGSPTTVRTVYTKMATTSAMETFEGLSTSSNTLSATGSSTNTSIALLESYIVTGANSSIFTIGFRSEVGGSAVNISSGSYCQTIKVG